MAEQSIRDGLAKTINGACEAWLKGALDTSMPEFAAGMILASPVIRRIQAEALRSALADIQAYTDAGAPFGHRPVEQFLSLRADRVEAGEIG